MKIYKMKDKSVIYFIFFFVVPAFCDPQQSLRNGKSGEECWMKVPMIREFFDTMDKIDQNYKVHREAAQKYIKDTEFDKGMAEAMLRSRGVAIREAERSEYNKLPAGLNLGGLAMMRLPDSVVFFHRMKLRNSTLFNLNVVHNDLENMVLKAHLDLNHLHLQGAFERAITDRDPSRLIYAPTFGELRLLLSNAALTMEGRYRLINRRLVVEVLMSELHVKEILMQYESASKDNPVIKLRRDNVFNFLEKLKTDLNKWLKDYFNDYLIFTELDNVPYIDALEKYDKEKAQQLAIFTDNVIVMIRQRLRELGASAITLPEFSIMAAQGMKIKIYSGTLRGLDTIHRRSVSTTAAKRPDFRKVDCIIGFSELRIVYKYEVKFQPGAESSMPLNGELTLTSNELTGHLSLGFMKNPEAMDLDLTFLDQIGPESLSIDGAANIFVANMKHLLRTQLATIMSNTLFYGVGMLKSLPRCKPYIPGLSKKPLPKSYEFMKPATNDGDQTSSIESKKSKPDNKIVSSSAENRPMFIKGKEKM